MHFILPSFFPPSFPLPSLQSLIFTPTQLVCNAAQSRGHEACAQVDTLVNRDPPGASTCSSPGVLPAAWSPRVALAPGDNCPDLRDSLSVPHGPAAGVRFCPSHTRMGSRLSSRPAQSSASAFHPRLRMHSHFATFQHSLVHGVVTLQFIHSPAVPSFRPLRARGL